MNLSEFKKEIMRMYRDCEKCHERGHEYTTRSGNGVNVDGAMGVLDDIKKLLGSLDVSAGRPRRNRKEDKRDGEAGRKL